VKILQDVARSRFRFITLFEGEKLEKIIMNWNKTEHMRVADYGSLWQSLVSSSKSCMICTQCRGHCGARSGRGSKLNKFMWAVEFWPTCSLNITNKLLQIQHSKWTHCFSLSVNSLVFRCHLVTFRFHVLKCSTLIIAQFLLPSISDVLLWWCIHTHTG
jgi:hypothetical protein